MNTNNNASSVLHTRISKESFRHRFLETSDKCHEILKLLTADLRWIWSAVLKNSAKQWGKTVFPLPDAQYLGSCRAKFQSGRRSHL